MDRDTWLLVAILLVVVACLLGSTYVMEVAGCYGKTGEIGYAAKYDFWGGCLIEVKEGQWIPLDSYYFKEE